jgi:CheY-like chemotaxis protein
MIHRVSDQKTAAILVAEDDPDDRSILELALSSACAGVPLRSVCDGQEVMDYLQGKPPYDDRVAYPIPSLLLLDLKMPRRSGLETLEWIRSRPEFERLAVVILSGSNRKNDIDRAYGSGANFYLMKPHKFSDLAPMLKSIATELIHSPDLLDQSLVGRNAQERAAG